jgi:hypothetical protein
MATYSFRMHIFVSWVLHLCKVYIHFEVVSTEEDRGFSLYLLCTNFFIFNGMCYFQCHMMLSLIIIQAMAVYNHLSKKNEDMTSSPASTDKSAEYFSDDDCETPQVKSVSTKPILTK